MRLLEIRKAIYKEKAKATVLEKTETEWKYSTTLKSGFVVKFDIPLNDMGIRVYKDEEDARILLRWVDVEG